MSRTTRWRAVICYLLAAAALGFYLVTLYQGMHPRVSAEYQAYYLDQELYAWPGAGGLSIQRGQTIRFDGQQGGDGQGVNHILRDQSASWHAAIGWAYWEDQGYQIIDRHAPLLFVGQPGESYHGSVTLLPPQSGGSAAILVNGEQVVSAALLQEGVTLEFDIPALPEDGRMTLEFVLDGDAHAPVAVKELILT